MSLQAAPMIEPVGLEEQPNEKMSVIQQEHKAATGVLSPEDMQFLENFTEAQRKKVIRKVDVCAPKISS